MKSLPSLFIAALACAAYGPLHAQDLRANPFFQALSGHWKGEGHLTGTGQNRQPLRNRIEAQFDDTGHLFTIKGSLLVGEELGGFTAEPLTYRWEFRQSRTEGLYDGRLFILSGDGDIHDYEVSIDEPNLTARLLQISGTSGEPRFELTKKIEGEEYLILITQLNPNGETSATGELRFRREL